MGLLSSSKSTSEVNYTTNSTTTNQDNRVAAGDNSLIVQMDGNGNSFSTSNTTTTNNVDTSQIGGTGATLIRLDGAGASYVDSRDLSDNRVTNNYSADAGIISAAGNALSSASTTVSGTLPFLKGVTDNAFNAARDLGNQLSSGYAKFSSDTLSMYNSGNARATAAEQAAYAFSRSSLDNTLNFGRDALTTSKNQSDTALSTISTTTDRLLNYITQSEKDPSERAFTSTLPWLVGGAVIIGVFAFGSRSK